MFMVEFFFDDSGKESWLNEKFVCIAGYLGINDQWDEFIELWIRKLMKHGIDHIHMRELIHQRGQYSEWSMEQREIVLYDFIDIIKNIEVSPFAVILDVPAWRSMPTKILKKYGSAQHFCFLALIAKVIKTIYKYKPDDLLHIYTDTDPDFAKARFNLFSHIRSLDSKFRDKIPSFTFADSKVYNPIQASDLLAWTLRRESVSGPNGSQYTELYLKLTDGLNPPPWLEILDADNLNGIIESIENSEGYARDDS